MEQEEKKEEQQEQEEVQEETQRTQETQGAQPEDIYTFLDKFPNSPSREQIDQWKSANSGHVFLSNFPSTKEIFVWRPLRRIEYRDILDRVGPDDKLLEENVVQRCVLWPKITVEYLQACYAGTLTTLMEQVLQGSNFLNPQMAIAMVSRL